MMERRLTDDEVETGEDVPVVRELPEVPKLGRLDVAKMREARYAFA